MASGNQTDESGTPAPAEPDASRERESDAAPAPTDAAPDPMRVLHRVACAVRQTIAGLWHRARSLSVHGAGATRPLQVALRATGLAVAAFAPLWPLFGSDIDGWLDWFLTMLANLGIGIALFGAGETVRMIADIHATLVGDGGGLAARQEDDA